MSCFESKRTERRFSSVAMAILLLWLSACSAGTSNEEYAMEAAEPAGICERAAAHLQVCTGTSLAPDAGCDETVAQALLDEPCESLSVGVTDKKADGGFLAKAACRLGLLAACPVPQCVSSKSQTPVDECIEHLGSGDCQECSYYDCMDEMAGCGSEGYFVGYVGSYCKRFSLVTEPRLSKKGQAWMQKTRTCLISRMDDWYEEGKSCGEIRERGIDDHNVCYVDSGFCSLWLTDWAAIVATIRPLDIPMRNLFFVGQACLKSWFGANGSTSADSE